MRTYCGWVIDWKVSVQSVLTQASNNHDNGSSSSSISCDGQATCLSKGNDGSGKQVDPPNKGLEELWYDKVSPLFTFAAFAKFQHRSEQRSSDNSQSTDPVWRKARQVI